MRIELLSALAVILVVVGAASPARAHADEHDVRRIAAGTVAGVEITVWSSDVATEFGLPLTIGVTGAQVEELSVLSIDAGDRETAVRAEEAGGGHWTAIVPVTESGTTSLEVIVSRGASSGSLQFGYTAASASWWMKAIVILAMFQATATALWLWGRRHRAFGTNRLDTSWENRTLVDSISGE